MTGQPTALVTGASRGIGNAIAHRLAEAGWNLTICARKAEGLAAAEEALAATGARVTAVQADMAVEEDVSHLAQSHLESAERLDALVIGAGFGTISSIEDASLRKFDKQFAVNVRAPYALVQGLLPLLRKTAALNETNGVKIIALSSITGAYPEPDHGTYAATKAALGSLCGTINTELSASGISATAICPGYVDTDMTEWVRETVDPAEMIATADIAELALGVTRLSRYAVVPELVVTRPGRQLHRA